MDDDDFYDEMLALQGWLPTSTRKEKNKDMEKKFSVMTPNYLQFKTYEDAEKDAKQKVARNHQDYVIVQATALANTPTPDVSVTKL